MAKYRRVGVPVKMGGPAFGIKSGDFEPGMYVKLGYTITSRGCPNNCWFCSVPKREGKLRELEIKDGWNILDDNLLACSEEHIKAVFAMVERQERKAIFTGGLEAKILKHWHCEELKRIGATRLYFAYDTPDDYEPLVRAGRMLREAGITAASHAARCYCLIGYKGDTFTAAEKRLYDTIKAGFMPYPMLFKDKDGTTEKAWAKLQREWMRGDIAPKAFKKIWVGEQDGQASKNRVPCGADNRRSKL